MKLDFLSLEGIEKSDSYRGPFVLFSRLEYVQGLARPKCTGGHSMDLIRVYKAPKVLLKPLRRRGLLAQSGVFENVIIFDHYALSTWIAGYRERILCAKCFFSKLLLAVGPTCPICCKNIRAGIRLFLYELTANDKRRWRKMIKVVRVTEMDLEGFVSCCEDPKRKKFSVSRYAWSKEGLILSKKSQKKA